MRSEHLRLLARWAHHRTDEYNAFVGRSQNLTERQAKAELLLTMLEAIAADVESNPHADFNLVQPGGCWSAIWSYGRLEAGDEADDDDVAIALLKVYIERLERLGREARG